MVWEQGEEGGGTGKGRGRREEEGGDIPVRAKITLFCFTEELESIFEMR